MEKEKEKEKETSRNHKKKYGQYFTTHSDLKEKVFSFILNRPSLILEPSIGRGDLVAYIQERMESESVQFDMVEIDPTIDFLATIDREKIHFGDFLIIPSKISKYTTIVGNPPYVRMQNTKKNLYIRFIEKCFDLLEEETGELIFIIPSDFFQLTSALPILNKMMEAGTFTHIYYPQNERLFEDASIDILVFRYCKNPNLEKIVLYNDEPRQIRILSSFQFVPISISLDQDQVQEKKETVSSLFDVFVGMVSGRDEIFKHNEYGNISVLTGENKREKFIFIDTLSELELDYKQKIYLESNKTELLSRRIRKFHENNWFEWGAPRNITTIRRFWGQPCIYMSNLTRGTKVAFLGKVEYFGGGILMLLPKSQISLETILNYFNSSEFQQSYRFSGRFKMGQRQLCGVPLV